MKFICKRNRTTKNKKKGFTLIELMAVIAIVAILAAAFLPKITGFINESKKVAVINEASKVVAAYEAIKTRSATAISDNAPISELITKSSGLLNSDDIGKIDKAVTISKCIQILDTEKYSFTITNGEFTTSDKITEYNPQKVEPVTNPS